MHICDDKKFVFCHIPKTGGRSIAKMVRPLCNRRVGGVHTRMRRLLRQEPDLEDYFSFCMVRNPYDRVLSAYRFLFRRERDIEFREFVLNLENYLGPQGRKFRHFGRHFITPCYDFITVEDEIVVKQICRFEHFLDSLAPVAERLGFDLDGMEHIGKSAIGAMEDMGEHYSHYYDDEMKAMVATVYANDLKAFGYTFEEN